MAKFVWPLVWRRDFDRLRADFSDKCHEIDSLRVSLRAAENLSDMLSSAQEATLQRAAADLKIEKTNHDECREMLASASAHILSLRRQVTRINRVAALLRLQISKSPSQSAAPKAVAPRRAKRSDRPQ